MRRGPGIAGLRGVWRAAVWFNWFWPHSLLREAGGCFRAHGPRGRRRLRWKLTIALSRVLGLLPARLGPGRWHHACRSGPPLILWWGRSFVPAAATWLMPAQPARLSGETGQRVWRAMLAFKKRIPVGAITAMTMGVGAIAAPGLPGLGTPIGAGELFTPKLYAANNPTPDAPASEEAEALETVDEFGAPTNDIAAADDLVGPAGPAFEDPSADADATPGSPPAPPTGLPASDLFAQNDLISPLSDGGLPTGGGPMTPMPEMPPAPPAGGGGMMPMGGGSGSGMDGVMPMNMGGGGGGGGGSGGGPTTGGGDPPTDGGPTQPLPPSDPPFTLPGNPPAPPVVDPDQPVVPGDDPFAPPTDGDPLGGNPPGTDPFDPGPTGGPGDDPTGGGLPEPPTELVPDDGDPGGDHGPGDVGGQTLRAVPEPAIWMSLILGFGALGGTLRRRRTRIA